MVHEHRVRPLAPVRRIGDTSAELEHYEELSKLHALPSCRRGKMRTISRCFLLMRGGHQAPVGRDE